MCTVASNLAEEVLRAVGEDAPSLGTINLISRVYEKAEAARIEAERLGRRVTLPVGDGFEVSCGPSQSDPEYPVFSISRILSANRPSPDSATGSKAKLGTCEPTAHTNEPSRYPSAVGTAIRMVGILVEPDERAMGLLEDAAGDCLDGGFVPVDATWEWDEGDDEFKERYWRKYECEPEIHRCNQCVGIFTDDYYDRENGVWRDYCRLMVPAPWRAAILALFEARVRRTANFWAVADPEQKDEGKRMKDESIHSPKSPIRNWAGEEVVA